MQSLYIIDFLFGVDKGTHLGDMIPEGIVGQGILWQMTCSKTFSALWAPEQSSNYPVENVYYSYRKSVQYLLMLCNLFSNFLWVLVILHHTNYSYSIVYSIIYFLSKQNIFSWKVVFLTCGEKVTFSRKLFFLTYVFSNNFFQGFFILEKR